MFIIAVRELKKRTVVYEAPDKLDFPEIIGYLHKQIPVLVIEPFWAHHHTKGLTGFPQHLPEYMQKLVRDGKVSLLKSKKINAKEIALLSAEMAVATVEAVYPAYRKRHSKIIGCVSNVLKSPTTENAFRMDLCAKLAEFHSVNIMIHRIEEYLDSSPITIYVDINLFTYLSMRSLLFESQQKFFEHPNVRFPVCMYVKSSLDRFKQKLMSVAKLGAQTIVAGFMRSGHRLAQKKKKKVFSYGMTIISPRQLRENRRSHDFLVDNCRILPHDVVYFPLMPLSNVQKENLRQLSSNVVFVPQAGEFFSNFHEWKSLFLTVCKQDIFVDNGAEINAAMSTFFHYFRWKKVLEDVDIKNFITHADFGGSHIGRNIALHQSGVQTWCFTDSANHNFIFEEEGKGSLRHPLWTFLYYDRFVTWNTNIAEYYQGHPGSSFKQTDVVGCIWSAHIKEKEQARRETSLISPDILDNFFLLSCFDSTYLRNVYCSYEEGIAFALHILQLVDEYPDIYVIFKEKKERSIHYVLDSELGPKLVQIYRKMESHPRITFYSNQTDTSEIIAISDMTVSFAFTSTTFEALSVNRPAIWHDPMGLYKDTLYGRIEGVTTRSYEELRAKVQGIKTMKPNTYRNPLPEGSPLLDPYRDGKAVERFRELLTMS